MTPTLRPATDDDRPFLLNVYASTREREMERVPWDYDQKASFLLMQFEAQDAHYRQHYPEASFDVVEADGEPVGRLYVSRWDEEIRIVDIALLPSARGHGLGSQLLADLLRESAEAGKAVSIHVEKENPARRLYERLGFREVEDRGVYLLMRREP
mgnify:CR=1 FL=1